MELQKFYIDGKWITPNSNETFNVINPASEEKVGEIILGNHEDVDLAVIAANKAFAEYSRFSKEKRISLLENLLEQTKRRIDDLAVAMSTEMGAPMTLARESQAEVGIGHLEAIIESLKEQDEEFTLKNGDTVVREPIGVCGLITPWNWPINQIVLKVAPALAAGCTCILKPSEYTPLSANIYAQMIHDAGFPPGVFNLIHGEGPIVGAALSKHSDIQMMSFTGSTRAGKAITCDASETIKKVTLELGGKSPNIVFDDSDLEKAVTNALEVCFCNTGQSCDAPTRLLVQRSCYDQVIELCKTIGNQTKLGDPSKEGDFLGPLFNKIQFDRVQTLIQMGIDEGAKVLIGGTGKPEGFEIGHYVKPTIFFDVSNEMQIARQEIFGPVLVIIPFEDEAEAIEIANDTPYGLAAYVQTNDLDKAKRVARALRAGSIYINGGVFNYGSPFGGFKQSGNGREGGEFGLEDYQELKSLHFG
ncbi:MAG: aldehyde dehydrogenase family protein [Bacteriovoracaceae bacterium]